jgi:proline iminopeptidase
MKLKRQLTIFTICFVLLNIFCVSSYSQNVKLKYSEGYIPTSDSVKLFYRILGEGKDTIVVIHGGGFGSSYLVPDLTPLAAHHTLLFFDQPGTGFSSVVKDTARLNINRFVQDVEIVRKYFHFQKVKMLAHSNGGLLCGYYATVFPNNIESLILVNPTAASQKWKGINRFDSTSLLILKQNRTIYRASPSDTIKACWDYYAVWARGKFPTPLHTRRMWGDVCNCNQKNLLSPTLFYSLQSMGKWDITAQLSKVKARTLIVGGDMDETPVAAWEEWKNSLPNSQLLIINGTGHLPYVDNPSIFFTAAELFLQNKMPDSSVLKASGAGVVLSTDTKGTSYQQARASVIQIENELVHLLNNASWDSVAAIYAKDATIYAPGSPPISGQKAIASFWHTAAIRGMKSMELQLIDLSISGDQLTARGKYVMSNQQKEIIDIGKFIALYRKENNKWHLQTDMFNSSMETRSPIEVPDYLAMPKK